MNCQQTINDVNLTADVLTKDVESFNYTQHFTNDVHILGKLDVIETISGIETRKLVTLQNDTELSGNYNFENNIYIQQNLTMAENKSINGFDISTLADTVVTLDTDQHLHHMGFSTIEVHGHMVDTMNGKTLEEYRSIYQNTLHKEGSQSFGKVTFQENVIVDSSMTLEKINGFYFPEDFARTSVDTHFENHVEFKDTITTENVLVTDNIMDINITNFLDNIIYKDGNETISNSLTFTNEVVLEQDLLTESTINSIDFSQHLMLRDADQNITGHKTFTLLNLTGYDVSIVGDLAVSGLIDGVDLSDLDLTGMLVSRNETITGNKCFEETDYNRSVEYVNGIDLSALKDDIVTIDTVQTITSKKVFTELFVQSNITTSSTVNGVDLSELEKSMFTDQAEGHFDHLLIHGDLIINGDANLPILNQVDTSKLENIISKFSSNNFTTLIISGDSQIQNLEASTVNGLNISNIVYRLQNQTIQGIKTFTGNFNTSNLITTHIDQINFENFRQSVVTKDEEQIINGKKSYMGHVHILGNVESHLINSWNLSEWNYVRTEG